MFEVFLVLLKYKEENDNINKTKNKYYLMRIINHNGHFKLIYNSKIIKKTRRYNTKKEGTKEYKFYQGYFPRELEEYLQLKDRTLYFYQDDNNRVCITGKPPIEESTTIRIQSANQFSIPRMFFPNVTGKTLILTLDLVLYDPYMKREGLLTIKLQ